MVLALALLAVPHKANDNGETVFRVSDHFSTRKAERSG
jgi:hypothetical protein